jgi:uncharacterized protein involved in outer membrane biogenesis
MTVRGTAKTIAIVLGGFVLLAAALVFAVGALVDFNGYKPRLESVVRGVTGKQAEIAGNIHLGFSGFMPALKVRDVNIGAPGPAIRLGSLSIALPLRWPDEDNPWELFANLDNIRIDGKSYGDYGVPIRFLKDGFDIPDIKGKLDDGRLTGHISFRAHKLAVNLKVTDLDYSHIAEGVQGGHTKADIQLTATGETPARLTQSLNGRFMLVGSKGQMLGNAVDLWAGDLLSSVLSGPQKETHLNCAVADFDIVNGIAKSKTVMIDTDRVTVEGKGYIDLAKGWVHMRFTPAPKQRALVSLATPVNVEGPFGDVETTPDARSIAGKVGGLLLGVVNPAAALYPLMNAGTGGANPCAAYLQKKQAAEEGKP